MFIFLCILGYLVTVAIVAYLVGRLGWDEILPLTVVWPVSGVILLILFLITAACELGRKHS